MGTYREHSTRYSHDYSQRITEIYRQPAWRHWTSQLLHAISFRTAPLERRLEDPLEWLHERRCKDDCGGVITSYRIKAQWQGERRSEVPFDPRKDPDLTYWDKIERVGCKRMPFPAAVDIWLHYFDSADRVRVGTEEGPKVRRDHPGPAGGPDISFSDVTAKRMGSW
jgi:hypothetical protein